MIVLLRPPQLELDQAPARLVLWLCEPFDAAYSFRSTLAQIQQDLGGPSEASHELPAEQPSEDFVSGQFIWAGREFELYFERSLGYMQFSSPVQSDCTALERAVSRAAA